MPLVEKLLVMGTAAYVCKTCYCFQILVGQGGRDGSYLAPTKCPWQPPDKGDYLCGGKVVEIVSSEIDGVLSMLAEMWA